MVFRQFLLLDFLFLSFFYSKKPSAFWQFVLEAVEAAWGQKSIKWLIRHKFPLLRTATSLISWHKIQNWGHTRSLKCLKTSQMTLYIQNFNKISLRNQDFHHKTSITSPSVVGNKLYSTKVKTNCGNTMSWYPSWSSIFVLIHISTS